MSTRSYKVVKVKWEDWRQEILWLHSLTFGASAPKPELEKGMWLLVFDGSFPIGFAGMEKWLNKGYLTRCGVLPDFRGQGLQRRLIRARERYARRMGWTELVSDTREATSSANNLIREGFEIYTPRTPWSFKGTIYWRKRWNKNTK